VQTELRSNGALILILRPDNEIERLILSTMAAASGKGCTVSIAEEAAEDNSEFWIKVER